MTATSYAEPITSFDHRGPYGFLSNFHLVDVRLRWRAVLEGFDDTNVYPSVEHAYQAAKTLDMTERARFARSVDGGAFSSGQAKRAGKTVTMRADWNEVRLIMMEGLLWQKFDVPTGPVHADLAARLVATKPRELIEGNTWGDTFWGVCRGKGENHLGRLLMRVRDSL